MEINVWVSTYAKYNNGSLQGEWVNLLDFDSKEDFLEECQRIHSESEENEFMFQDREVPEGLERLVTESWIDEDIWNIYQEINDDDKFELYCKWTSQIGYDFGSSIDKFNECYQGDYSNSHDPIEDYAYDFVQDCYNLDEMMGNLSCYFDYEKFSRDLSYDVNEIDGHIFNRY